MPLDPRASPKEPTPGVEESASPLLNAPARPTLRHNPGQSKRPATGRSTRDRPAEPSRNSVARRPRRNLGRVAFRPRRIARLGRATRRQSVGSVEVAQNHRAPAALAARKLPSSSQASPQAVAAGCGQRDSGAPRCVGWSRLLCCCWAPPGCSNRALLAVRTPSPNSAAGDGPATVGRRPSGSRPRSPLEDQPCTHRWW